MPRLDQYPYIRIVDVVSEKAGHDLLLIGGVPSEQPLAEAFEARVARIAREEAAARLTDLNNAIDLLYDRLNELREGRRRAATDQAREDIERQLARCLHELKETQARAAQEMRQQFEASGVVQVLKDGLLAMNKAKELKRRCEDSSNADSAQ